MASNGGRHLNRVRSSHRCWQTYTAHYVFDLWRISGDVAMPQAMGNGQIRR